MKKNNKGAYHCEMWWKSHLAPLVAWLKQGLSGWNLGRVAPLTRETMANAELP